MSTIKTYQNENKIWIVPSALCMQKDSHQNYSIAIRLVIEPNEQLISWEDTNRTHTIKMKNYVVDKNCIRIVSEDGSNWTFEPLTLKNFNKIKSNIAPISQSFKSDLELQNYYADGDFLD